MAPDQKGPEKWALPSSGGASGAAPKPSSALAKWCKMGQGPRSTLKNTLFLAVLSNAQVKMTGALSCI